MKTSNEFLTEFRQFGSTDFQAMLTLLFSIRADAPGVWKRGYALKKLTTPSDLEANPEPSPIERSLVRYRKSEFHTMILREISKLASIEEMREKFQEFFQLKQLFPELLTVREVLKIGYEPEMEGAITYQIFGVCTDKEDMNAISFGFAIGNISEKEIKALRSTAEGEERLGGSTPATSGLILSGFLNLHTADMRYTRRMK